MSGIIPDEVSNTLFGILAFFVRSSSNLLRRAFSSSITWLFDDSTEAEATGSTPEGSAWPAADVQDSFLARQFEHGKLRSHYQYIFRMWTIYRYQFRLSHLEFFGPTELT